MSEVPPTNLINVSMKKFDSHMVTADYNIILQSTNDSVETLIKRIPEIKKELGI